MWEFVKQSGMGAPSTTGRRSPHMLALEPRWMYDGAALAALIAPDTDHAEPSAESAPDASHAADGVVTLFASLAPAAEEAATFDVQLDVATVEAYSPSWKVVGTFSVVEELPEGSKYTYSLTDDADGRFFLADNQLVVADGTLLNPANGVEFTITVQVSDPDGNIVEESFTLTLQDSGGGQPEGIILDNATVVEESPGGTVVGTLAMADISAGDVFTYTLLNDADGRFAIVDDKLVVNDGDLIDDEDGPYTIVVQVSEPGGNALIESFTITALDGNEPPMLIELSNATVTENSPPGTVVGELHAEDPDTGDSVTYTLINDAGGLFALEGDDLVVKQVIDFEVASSYAIVVRATDSAGNIREQEFIIRVRDEGEVPPPEPDDEGPRDEEPGDDGGPAAEGPVSAPDGEAPPGDGGEVELASDEILGQEEPPEERQEEQEAAAEEARKAEEQAAAEEEAKKAAEQAAAEEAKKAAEQAVAEEEAKKVAEEEATKSEGEEAGGDQKEGAAEGEPPPAEGGESPPSGDVLSEGVLNESQSNLSQQLQSEMNASQTQQNQIRQIFQDVAGLLSCS